MKNNRTSSGVTFLLLPLRWWLVFVFANLTDLSSGFSILSCRQNVNVIDRYLKSKKHFQLTTRSVNKSTPTTTQLHWHSSISKKSNGIEAADELLNTIEIPSSNSDEEGLLLLFVSQSYAKDFPNIVKYVQDRLLKNQDGDSEEKESAEAAAKTTNITFLALIGGGVISYNREFDDPYGPPVMSALSGILPPSANAKSFSISTKGGIDGSSSDNGFDTLAEQTKGGTSHILFVDPWSDTEEIIKHVGGTEDVIVGGLSCPQIGGPASSGPSVAVNGNALPQGSAVGVTFTGSFGIQAVVAQGCRPIGPTFTITSASGNILNGLDDKSALEQLKIVASSASDSDRKLIETSGLACGVAAKNQQRTDNDDSSIRKPTDFLIRQIMGLINSGQGGDGGGAIALGVRDLREGDQFQFHVRDAEAARDDIRVMVQRTKTERLFAGPQQAGTPVAALQVSCVARGKSLFGTPNVDLKQVQQLLGRPATTIATTSDSIDDDDDDEMEKVSPIAGFFANGEIGPVGISGFDSKTKQGTHIHGFTTVIGLLCDYCYNTQNNSSSSQSSGESASSSISTTSTSTLLVDDADAWG